MTLLLVSNVVVANECLKCSFCGQVGEVKSLGDKIREAVPGLSEVPSPGQAVQAGKDLVGKLPSAGDVQGARPPPR